MTTLTNRFEEALVFAAKTHQSQIRKGSQTPYIAHLLAVTALVLENGGDEDQAIAALLHDAAEDQGGREILYEIEVRFGHRVSNLVMACSDTIESPKPPWQKRKEKYISHLLSTSSDALLISLADKVHNAQSILEDYQIVGDSLWDRFNGKKEGTLWYYRTLADTFQKIYHCPLSDKLAQIITSLESTVA